MRSNTLHAWVRVFAAPSGSPTVRQSTRPATYPNSLRGEEKALPTPDNTGTKNNPNSMETDVHVTYNVF